MVAKVVPVAGWCVIERPGVVEVVAALRADGVGWAVGQSGAGSHFESQTRLDGVGGAGFGFPGPPFTLPLWLGYQLKVAAELHVDVLVCFFEVFKIKCVQVHHELTTYEVVSRSKERRKRWRGSLWQFSGRRVIMRTYLGITPIASLLPCCYRLGVGHVDGIGLISVSKKSGSGRSSGQNFCCKRC